MPVGAIRGSATAAYGRRDDDLAGGRRDGGRDQAEPEGNRRLRRLRRAISAVRAARSIVNDGTRIAIDVGDLEMRDDEPVGPPLARAARLVAIAHPGQVLLSSAAHDALAAGCADRVGRRVARAVRHRRARPGRPRLPTRRPRVRLGVPAAAGRPAATTGPGWRRTLGAGLRVASADRHRTARRGASGVPAVGRPRGRAAHLRPGDGVPSAVRAPLRDRIAADHPRRASSCRSAARLLARAEPGRDGESLDDRGHISANGSRRAASARHRRSRSSETIASAVASAHRHGVVHGRIRPENVLFDAEDNAFVADLGHRRDLLGSDHVREQRLRRTGAPRRRIGDTCVRHLLARRPRGAPAGRFATTDRRGARRRGGSGVRCRPPRHRSGSSPTATVDRRADGASSATRSRYRPSPSATFVPTRNPYRGLEAFEQADADDFYGRDRCGRRDGRRSPARAAADRRRPIGNRQVVRRQGRLAASARRPERYRAPRAGSSPRLVPGREPFEQLAAALGRVASTDLPDVVGALLSASRSLGAVVDELAPGHPGVLIVIDQLEELFTQTDRRRRATRVPPDAGGRRAHAGFVVRLVATLRADYFDRPLAYPGFDDAIHGRTVALGAMSSDELADAVRLPASAVGVQIEPGVVDRIVAEAELQPGALPLVQHTLSELFRTRTTNTITVADLDEVGGVAGAIGRRAEQIYAVVRRSLPRRRATGVPPARQRHRGARRHAPACPSDGARAGRDRHRRPRHGARASTAAIGC